MKKLFTIFAIICIISVLACVVSVAMFYSEEESYTIWRVLSIAMPLISISITGMIISAIINVIKSKKQKIEE